MNDHLVAGTVASVASLGLMVAAKLTLAPFELLAVVGFVMVAKLVIFWRMER